jgi:3'-phosphoadenosine 5'-phosphosulfate sulfotransferase (PAPS reductase)/FAD synthetase
MHVPIGQERESVNSSVGLMYSGGVDSVLCLKMLREQEITPVLFYIKTTKLKRKHIQSARRNAKRLSPKSPFYIIRPHTLDYNAVWDSKTLDYYVYLDEWANKEAAFHPLQYVDKIAVGYFRCIGGKRAKGETGIGQPELIKFVRTYNLPIILPLKEKTGKEIDKMFSELPLDIQQDTVSSTRFYKHGAQTVGKALCTTRLGDYTD